MLAISSWTWIVAAAFGLVSIGLVLRMTLGLIVRLKDLNRTLAAASGDLREALDSMRSDLDEMNEGLSELGRRAEKEAS